MSIHRSYFSKNNTIIYNSYTNTAKSPVIELFFGGVDNLVTPKGFSRFIFDLDLTELLNKVNNKDINLDCGRSITHTLRMKNTSFFDKELLNDSWSNGKRRATSFDLILYRIPEGEIWDEGVGYDYYGGNSSSDSNDKVSNKILTDKSFSTRPSNWFQTSTINQWVNNGIYNSLDDLTIIDVQHFDNGNEDIEFDMTSEINSILNGELDNVSGWGISFYPQLENITGLTENYTVGFYSKYTQTFYEPFLETKYDDLVIDNRNDVNEMITNKLYLYSFKNGNPLSFDNPPRVDIFNSYGEILPSHSNLETCEITKGVYEVVISGLTADTLPCMYYDTWKEISIDGVDLNFVENQFVLNSLDNTYSIGIEDNEPKLYGFDFYGIKQDEKILNTDIRKVNVVLKKAYTTQEVLTHVDASYRIYVKEGTTEVQVQDWTPINRTNSGYYFLFDTKDKIPNEYFVDIKVVSDREVNTYKRELKFQIVNKK